MRFVSAFIQFTSNAAAVKRELRMYEYFELKQMDKDRAKMESVGDIGGGSCALHHVLVCYKSRNYSLTEQQVDLVLCARIAGKGESPSDTASK